MDSIIDDVICTELKQISDERGTVLHMFRCDSPEFTRFGECYFSEILPGSIKAWKRHKIQTQNFAVPVGRIQLVIYDDRKESNTRGNLDILQLGRADAYYRISIPPNLWYGFACIGTSPALLANCPDFPHDPFDSEVLLIDDKSIPYSWHTTFEDL